MKNTYTNIILYYHGENSRFTNYRYTVEACYNDGYYYPLIAFNTKKKLLYWLNTLGLTFGKRSGNMIRINGSYSRCALMDVEYFQKLKKRKPRFCVVQENGAKTMGLYFKEEKTVYYLNCNVSRANEFSHMIFKGGKRFNKYCNLCNV